MKDSTKSVIPFKATSPAALEYAKKIYDIDRSLIPQKDLEEITARIAEFRSIVEKEADRLKLGYFIDVYAATEEQQKILDQSDESKAVEVRFSSFSIHKANSGEVALTLLNMLQVDLSKLSEEKFRILEAIRQLYFALEFLHANGGSDSCQCENCVARRESFSEENSSEGSSTKQTMDVLSFLKDIVSVPVDLKTDEKAYAKFLEEKLNSLQKTDKDKLN